MERSTSTAATHNESSFEETRLDEALAIAFFALDSFRAVSLLLREMPTQRQAGRALQQTRRLGRIEDRVFGSRQVQRVHKLGKQLSCGAIAAVVVVVEI
jgi:CRP-like cAMP-binding protein